MRKMLLYVCLVVMMGCGESPSSVSNAAAEKPDDMQDVPVKSLDGDIHTQTNNKATMAATSSESGFRMPIADAFEITGVGVVLTGQVASGAASVGDWVCVPMQDGQLLGRKIIELEVFRTVLARIEVGQQAGVTLERLEHSQIDQDADLVAGCAAGTPIP